MNTAEMRRLAEAARGTETGDTILRLLDVVEAVPDVLAVAQVADDGDPWFAQDAGLDAEAIIARVRAALAALEG